MLNVLKDKVVIAALLVGVAASFATGWMVNGWRLGEDLAEAQANVALLSQSIERQNAAVNELNNKRKEAESKYAAAQKNAIKVSKQSSQRIEQLKQRIQIADTCDGERQEILQMLEWAR